MYLLLKKPSAWVPIAIPLVFFAVLIFGVMFGTIHREKDEGVGAHLFQIWLVLEPFMLGYFAITYLPRAPKQAVLVLALQIAAALLPISVVFTLKL